MVGSVLAGPVAGDVAAGRARAASRASAPARSSRSRWRPSPTCSRRPSAAGTRACSARSSRSRACSARRSAACITDTIGWPFVFFINIPVGASWSCSTVRRYLPRVPPGRRAAEDRLPRRGAVHRRARPDPRRADQQAGGRLDRPVGRRADRASASLILAAFVVRRVAGGRADRAARAVPQPRVHGLGRRRRSSRRSGSSPRSCSCRAGSRWSAASSATISGYQMLPLLGGVIISAVASGQIVARTGRYRLLMFGALVLDGRRAWPCSPSSAPTRRCRSCGPGCSSPGSASGRCSRCSRSSSRTACRSTPDRRRLEQPVVLPAGRRDGRARDHRDGVRHHDDPRGAGGAGRPRRAARGGPGAARAAAGTQA